MSMSSVASGRSATAFTSRIKKRMGLTEATGQAEGKQGVMEY